MTLKKYELLHCGLKLNQKGEKMGKNDSKQSNELWDNISLFIAQDKFILSCPVHNDFIGDGENCPWGIYDGPYADVEGLPAVPLLVLKQLDMEILIIQSIGKGWDIFETDNEKLQKAKDFVKENESLFQLISESDIQENWFDREKGNDNAIRLMTPRAAAHCAYHIDQDAAVKIIDAIRNCNWSTFFDYYYVSTKA